MPIAGYKIDAKMPTQPNLPKIEPEGYRSVIYDDNNLPLHSLISYIEGSPWAVNYYSQILSKHNDLRELDLGQPTIYQQYQKIVNLEIRVSSPLTSNYDSETGITTTTGNGLLYPFIVPNISDYFVTDVADNALAIFRITNVERRTFNRDSVFSIDYDLVGYVSVLLENFNDLESKVNKTYHFNKDRLVEGLQPLLKDSDQQDVINFKAYYTDITKYYFKTFFNRKYMTLVVPGQEYAIYDAYLVNYLLKIVDTFDAPEIRSIRRIPVEIDPYFSQPQLWELLLNKDYDSLKTCNSKMGIVSKFVFNKNTHMFSAVFSNIDYIIYPLLPDTSIVLEKDPLPKVLSLVSLRDLQTTDSVLDLIRNQYVTDVKTFQLFYSTIIDDYYVLSSDFYNNTNNQSVLEILVKDYLRNKTLDSKMLLTFANIYKTLTRLDQYYYGPILLTLLKEANRSVYR